MALAALTVFAQRSMSFAIYMYTRGTTMMSSTVNTNDMYSSSQNKSHISFSCDGRYTKIWLLVSFSFGLVKYD